MAVAGFDCEFVEKPSSGRSRCPICLFVLREPVQVTCCGKNFCRVCIQEVAARLQPCPTCKYRDFDSFPDKGLQQELYSAVVFCSNKDSGCSWKGELRQLDKHLDPSKAFINPSVKCALCSKVYQGGLFRHHYLWECTERAFSCPMCEEYRSTYNDVITNHFPTCECRPVECPRLCGASNLQHQDLEEHVSTQCPVPQYVDCEFSPSAGRDGLHKDLTSHLIEDRIEQEIKSRLQKQSYIFRQEKMSLLIEIQKQDENIKKLHTIIKQQAERQEAYEDIIIPTVCTLKGTDPSCILHTT